MIVPVVWQDKNFGDMTPDWGQLVPALIPAQSPFAAQRQQEASLAFFALQETDGSKILMDLIYLEKIEPSCLERQDDDLIHLALVNADNLLMLWPLIDRVLVLPFSGEWSPAWQKVELDWTRYEVEQTHSQGSILSRPSAKDRLDELVRAGSCDLHMHTNASDGTDSTEDLFARVKKNQLASFAVTDHDLLDSLDKMSERVLESCQNIAKPYCPVFVPGVEISVSEGRELHVLGYFPFGGHKQLEDFLTQQRQARHARNVDMVRQLQSLGYEITLPDLVEKGQGVVGRMQAALLLVERGYVQSTQEAFEKVLGFGKPGYVERPRPSLQEAIWQIRRSGGVPVLAHPAIYHWCSERPLVNDKLIKKLRNAQKKGLLGVEAFHGEASREACLEISAAARYLGLLRTCGSDDHGKNKKHTALFDQTTHFLAGKEILVVGALIKARENAWLIRTEAVDSSLAKPDSSTRYLLARRATRGYGLGKWELPGGKVEPGEQPRPALQRELQEELGLDSEIGPLAELLTHDYEGFRIILACYVVRLKEGSLQLTAHDKIAWVSASEALGHDVLAADIALFQELARQER